MTRRNWMGFAAMLVAGLFLAGCGGDDGGLSGEEMARISAAETAAAAAQAEAEAAHAEAEAAHEEAEEALADAAAAQAEAAAAKAEAEKEVEIPEPDTSDLEETIAALEEQIEELESDAEIEAERVSLLGMSAGERIISILDGTKPVGSVADVAARQAAIMSQLKSPAASVWYKGANIIPDAVIAGSGLFYDLNGDGVLNNNADRIAGTADDLLDAAGGTIAINEFRLGRNLNGAAGPALEADVPAAAVLLDERMFGDLNGDSDELDIVNITQVVESGITGKDGTFNGADLDGDGIISSVVVAGAATIDEGVLNMLLSTSRVNNVGYELRQSGGRYQFQYDDDGDNNPADVVLTAAVTPALTEEGIDMRDHLSTFSLTPVLGVDGVNLVKFQIDSAYESDRNLSVTLPNQAPDANPSDDVPTTKDGRYGVESYGAWLSDSFFAIHKFTAVTNVGANTAGTAAGAGVAAATRATTWVANRSGGSPSTLRGLGESATWTGAMVGHDTLATAEADMLLQGNARIDARITTGTLATADAEGVAVMDVMLDNITNQEGMDARVTELSWSALDIITATNGGVGFRKARSADPRVEAEIEGWVFGDAEEIVGQFSRSGIIGAFGATLDADAGMMDMASDQ